MSGHTRYITVYDMLAMTLIYRKNIAKGKVVKDKLFTKNTIYDLSTRQEKFIYNSKAIISLGNEVAVIFDEGVAILRNNVMNILPHYSDMNIITLR